MDYIENTHETAERIKSWWKKYGNMVTTIILVVMLALVGMQYWQRHQQKVHGQASLLFQQMQNAVQQKNTAKTTAFANTLKTEYAKSVYAKFAAFTLAQQAVNAGKLNDATEQLQWAVNMASTPSIKSIAQIRLARVLMAQNKAEHAIDVLKAVSSKAFVAQADMLRGDALVMLKKPQAAKNIYQTALAHAGQTSPLYHLIQIRLASI